MVIGPEGSSSRPEGQSQKKPDPCVVCGRTDYVRHHKLQVTCWRKDCKRTHRAAQVKEERRRNPEKFLAREAAYRAGNRDKIIASSRAAYAANPELKRAQARASYHRHPDRHREAHRARYIRLKAGNQTLAQRLKAAEEQLRQLRISNSANQPVAMGRPRKEHIRKRVIETRAEGKSWSQLTMLLNRELGLKLSKDAYRSYGEKSE